MKKKRGLTLFLSVLLISLFAISPAQAAVKPTFTIEVDPALAGDSEPVVITPTVVDNYYWTSVSGYYSVPFGSTVEAEVWHGWESSYYYQAGDFYTGFDTKDNTIWLKMAFKRISTGARLTDRTAYSTVYNQNYNFDMTLHGQIVRRYGDVTPIGWRGTVQYIDYSNRYHRATAEQVNSSLPGYVGMNVDVS